MKIDFEEIFEKYFLHGLGIVVIIIGIMMIFVSLYTHHSVEFYEAKHIKAKYLSFEKRWQWSRGGLTARYILMYFDDLPFQEIESTLLDEHLEDVIRKLEPGTEVTMIIHPNTNAILDLKVKGKTILNFYDSQKQREKDMIGSTLLGILTCGLGIVLFRLKKKPKVRYVKYKG